MPDKQPEVGDKIRVNMHSGIVNAIIIAIFDTTRGLRYQIDLGAAHCAYQRMANRQRQLIACRPQN
jgi:hypothetical protein